MPDTYLSFLARRTKGTLLERKWKHERKILWKTSIENPFSHSARSRKQGRHAHGMHWATLVKGPGTITGCCRPDPASPDQITSAEHKPRQPGEFWKLTEGQKNVHLPLKMTTSADVPLLCEGHAASPAPPQGSSRASAVARRLWLESLACSPLFAASGAVMAAGALARLTHWLY